MSLTMHSFNISNAYLFLSSSMADEAQVWYEPYLFSDLEVSEAVIPVGKVDPRVIVKLYPFYQLVFHLFN